MTKTSKKFHTHRQNTSRSGLLPGSLFYTGRFHDLPLIEWIRYNETEFEVQVVESITHIVLDKYPDFRHWIRVRGLNDVHRMREFVDYFEIHALTMEDVLNSGQLPKTEAYPDYLFVTLKHYNISSDEQGVNFIDNHQISLILSYNHVISFNEYRSSTFYDSILEGIKSGSGIILQKKVDYLAYLLLDKVVDHYYLIVEEMHRELNIIENDITERFSFFKMDRILSSKREILEFRKEVIPLRDSLMKMRNEEFSMIQKTNAKYFSDLLDHLQQVTMQIEILREWNMSVKEFYLNQVNLDMSKKMQIISVVSVLFLPLSFMAGIYGMNFDHMPELHWKYSYYVLIFAMIVLAIILLIIFKKKKMLE